MQNREYGEMVDASLRSRIAHFSYHALPYALGLFILTTPFSKITASVASSICIIFFVLHRFLARERRWVGRAGTYYGIIVAYCAVFTLGVIYSPDRANGVHEAWRQITRLMTPIILIEAVSREHLAKRYLYAFVAGGAILSGIGIFEAIFLHAFRPPTMWHPVHSANILLLCFTSALVLVVSQPNCRIYSLFSAVLILAGIYVTGTRGVWIAVVAVLFSLPFLLPRLTMRNKLSLAGAVLLFVAIFTQTPYFHERAKEALSDIKVYQEQGQSNPTTSVAERFDMWKASYYMFLKRPVFGIGTGAWRKGLEEVIEAGQVPGTLIKYGNPHNMFIEALTTRGIVGLAALCALLGYPAFLALRGRIPSAQAPYAVLILTASIGFAVGGLTDTLVIIRGVFTSYLIVIGLSLAVLFRPAVSAQNSIPSA